MNQQTNTSPLGLLLSRLTLVTHRGKEYQSKCPAHESKEGRSLYIRQADDGALLLHCFHGCSALEVVHSIGLELSDLYPQRDIKNMPPAKRQEMRELAQQCKWRAALDVLVCETRIVVMANEQLTDGIALTEEDASRVKQAFARIEETQGVLRC